MKRLWIFDIDGTLANNGHRIQHLKQNQKDWKKFFADQSNDLPYEAVMDLLRILNGRGDRCIIITGRDEQHREESYRWVNEHYGLGSFPECDLIMRKRDDRRDDDVIKLELLKEWMEVHGDHKVLGVFEDRHRVIDAWRNAGFYVFECNQTRSEF